MKRSRRQVSARGIGTAVALAAACVVLALLCVRAAIGNILAETPTALPGTLSGDTDVVLDRAATALVQRYGHLDEATLAAVRRGAILAPLDARPYLILGHQQLLDRQPDRAVKTFEAGQRLDPRQALIHVLLLDRYLRTGRYADAAPQMSVLTRINGATQAPIAKAFAAMALAPQTREAVSRTLRSDPGLERSVLIALIKGGVAPATIFSLASPVAHADAGQKDSWGPVLVDQLIAQHRYAEARGVWQRISNIDTAAAAPAIFDAAFRPSAAAPPFNWELVASGIGAADMRNGGLAVDYYGRDSGDLATQLLVLASGAYRFSFTVDPGKTDASSRLFWAVTCVGSDKPLLTVPITAGASSRRVFADFLLPSGCPAQQLALRGESGDLPAPVSITLRAPGIVARAGRPS